MTGNEVGGGGEVAVAAVVDPVDLDHDAVAGLVRGLVSTLAAELGDGVFMVPLREFMVRLNNSPATALLPPFGHSKKAPWMAEIRAAIFAAMESLKELKLMRAGDPLHK